MREKFNRFMAGRYGMDQLGRFMVYACMVLLLLGILLSDVLRYLAVVLLVIIYVRVFSRNFEKRRRENEKFLRLKYKFTGGFGDWRDRQKQRKDYVFFRCPSCKVMLRVPRGKGKIRVTCRKCGNSFERRT